MKRFARGEIWLAQLDPTRGREQAGTRPVLIVSSNYFNHGYADLVYALPLTTTIRNIATHIEVTPPEAGLKKRSVIMCEAMRSLSKQRFIKNIGQVSGETMEDVEDNLRILIDL